MDTSSAMDVSPSFEMYIPQIGVTRRINVLDLKNPVLSESLFMNIVNKRVQELDTIASSHSWTRNIHRSEEQRALRVILGTSTPVVGVADRTLVVIPCVFRDQDEDTCASQCMCFASFLVDKSRIARKNVKRLVVSVSNVRVESL